MSFSFCHSRERNISCFKMECLKFMEGKAKKGTKDMAKAEWLPWENKYL